MAACRLGGNGIDSISKIYGLDNTVRGMIASAKKAGAHIYGGDDTRNDKWDVSIEAHDNVISDTPITESGWSNDMEELPTSGVTYSIVSGPSHGTLDTTNPVVPIYTGDPGYSGPDTFSYEIFVDGISVGVRNVCLQVVYQEGPKAWRPISPTCVLDEDGVQTGYKGWNTLEQYDTYSGNVTGVTKPNSPSDPDYVSPIYDPMACVPQVEHLLFETDGSKDTSTFAIWLNQYSGDIPEAVYLVAKQGGTIVKEEQIVISGAPYAIDLEEDEVQVYIKGDAALFDKIKQISIDGLAGADWGINGFYPAIFPELTKINISGQDSLTSFDWTQNTKLDRLEVFRNSLAGAMDTSMLPDLIALEYFDYNITSQSDLTLNPNLEYFNSINNPGLSGTPDFTACTNINTIFASDCDFTDIDISNLASLVRFEANNNNNLTSSFDLTTNPSLTVFAAVNCPLTDVVWDDNIIEGFFVANSNIPETSIHAGIAANKSTLIALQISSQHSYEGPFNLDNASNLAFLWLDDLPLCTGFSINNTGSIVNLNIAGMHLLSAMPSFAGNPFNAFIWLTGTGIGPTGVDAVLNYISGLNIPPIEEHEVGPGGIIYGDYETAIGSITPTAASLAAYTDLDSRGYTIIGPVPGS